MKGHIIWNPWTIAMLEASARKFHREGNSLAYRKFDAWVAFRVRRMIGRGKA
jgi:hypothetical protein